MLTFTNPCCGYEVNAAELVDPADVGPAEPHKGDICVCLNCGAILVYIDDKRHSRIAWPVEWQNVTARQKRILREAQAYIRHRGRIHKPPWAGPANN